MEEHKVVYESNPDVADLKIIENGLSDFDRTEFGRAGSQPFTHFLRDSQGTIVGGIHGNNGTLWAYVSALWVCEHLRGMGFGGQLLQAAESEAVSRGCSDCYLDTFNPRALEFYKKAGYTVFGELENFIPGGKRYFLRKRLF